MRPTTRGAFALFSLVALLAVATPAHAQWKAEGGVLIRGKIVTMDDQGTVKNGSLYIKDGVVKQILPANAPVPAGAIEVDTKGGLIFPGLMNLHNHIAYNFEELYNLPKKYTNRHQWPGAREYGPAVNNPKNLVSKGEYYDVGTESLKYAEVKCLAGGETTVQGTDADGGASTILVRNVELANFGQDKISQSVLPIDQRFIVDLANQKKKITGSDGYFFHLAEGIDTVSRSEYFNPTYDKNKNAGIPKNVPGLKNLGLVVPSLIGIHCTGLKEEDFQDWAKILRDEGSGAVPKVVWSPLSNLLLYGKTTDILGARKHGALIALGTDWSPSGSKNLLWELKIADSVNSQHFDGKLTTRDLVAMVTCNPAKMVKWDNKVGTIKVGMTADLMIVDKAGGNDPYRGLIDSMEQNVQLVLVGGDPLYGDETVLKTLKVYDNTPAYETVGTPGGRTKVLDLKRRGVPKGNQSLEEIQNALLKALRMDPAELAAKLNTPEGTGPDRFKDRNTIKTYLRTKLAAAGKPVPASLNDASAPITADQVGQFFKYKFPDAKPITRLDPIFQQGDMRYWELLKGNIFFRDTNPPLDLKKLYSYDKAITPGFLSKIPGG